LQRIRPDAEFTIEDESQKKCTFLLEVELTQKSKERLIEKLEHYHKIPDYRFILFVFPTPSLFNAYVRLYESHPTIKKRFNYIFALEPGLIKGNFSLESTKAYFKGKEVTLQNVLYEIAGRSCPFGKPV